MSTLEAKLKPGDQFWDEKATERKFVEGLETEIRRLEGAIALADRMLVLTASPGWEPFVQALRDCQGYRRVELELCKGSDSEVRILQGRVREITAMLTLMTQTKQHSEVLSEKLKQLRVQKAAVVRPDGKVQPQGAT